MQPADFFPIRSSLLTGPSLPARSGQQAYAQHAWSHAVGYGLIVLLVWVAQGIAPGAGATATTGLCALILVAGLPHGALDIELLVGQARRDIRITYGLIAIYLACAGATLALWTFSPIAGLVAFLLISIVHFAEDWAVGDDGFFAKGTALALLSAPDLLHHGEISRLFVQLTNDPTARYIADMMLLVAPVALAIAVAGLIADCNLRRFDKFFARAATLLAMLVLPPLVGFALYFCLFHSPRNLAHGLVQCRANMPRLIGLTILPVTLAAFGIAALVFTLSPRSSLSAAAIPTAFITLSLLTVPHMLVPMIFAGWTRSAAAYSR